MQRSVAWFTLGVTFAVVACDDAGVVTRPVPERGSDIRMAVGRGHVGEHPFDDVFVRIAERIPGFGGLVLQDGVPAVYLKDTTRAAALHAVLSEVYPGHKAIQGSRLIVKEGQFDFADLSAWRDTLENVMSWTGVSSVDVDEGINRIAIGVVDTPVGERLGTLVEQIGIPRAAVVFSIRKPPVRTSAPVSLSSVWDTLAGGIKITASTIGNCSLGMIVKRANSSDTSYYALTAGHCGGSMGQKDSVVWYQPLLSSGGAGSGYIGWEAIDPPYLNDPSPRCTTSGSCRWSDAQLINLSQSTREARGGWGRVARPTGYSITYSNTSGSPGPTTLGNPYYYSIVGETPDTTLFQGWYVHKLGATTWQTWGGISSTCWDTSGSPRLLCSFTSNGYVGGGDSGGPVFEVWAPNNLTIDVAGIVWGGDALHPDPVNGDRYYAHHFSPLRGIQRDLGTLLTYPGKTP